MYFLRACIILRGCSRERTILWPGEKGRDSAGEKRKGFGLESRGEVSARETRLCLSKPVCPECIRLALGGSQQQSDRPTLRRPSFALEKRPHDWPASHCRKKQTHGAKSINPEYCKLAILAPIPPMKITPTKSIRPYIDSNKKKKRPKGGSVPSERNTHSPTKQRRWGRHEIYTYPVRCKRQSLSPIGRRSGHALNARPV